MRDYARETDDKALPQLLAEIQINPKTAKTELFDLSTLSVGFDDFGSQKKRHFRSPVKRLQPNGYGELASALSATWFLATGGDRRLKYASSRSFLTLPIT
jgi:hypothetical protein